MFETHRADIEGLGRTAPSALRVYHAMQQKIILSIPGAAKRTKLSQPAVTKAFRNLERLGIVREKTGGRRNRLFVYQGYLKILEEGTEPIR